jgi:lipopolysaccharide export system protein LptA
MKIKILSVFPLYLIVAALLLSPLTYQTCLAGEQPIQIEADSMISLEKTRTIVFTGNVDAKQGDIRIRADKMTVYYTDTKTGSSKKSKDAQQVEKITCKGNVEVTSEEWLGTSDTMHYFSKKNLVQLIGHAKAYQGQNTVKGQRIDYHIDSGKSEIFGGTGVEIKGETAGKKPGRVNMTILEQ